MFVYQCIVLSIELLHVKVKIFLRRELGEFETVNMQIPDTVEGLHNRGEFSQKYPRSKIQQKIIVSQG